MTTKQAPGPGGQAANRRPRIAIDMDETIADSLGKHLREYNRLFAAELGLADLAGRTLEQAIPREHATRLRQIELDPTFFADLDVIADSQEVVRALAESYEVFIATAAMEVPTSFAAKYAWLGRHFPFIPPSHIVFCGDKGVLDVDYLIDDTARHFKSFRGTPVLYSAPHNRDERRFVRVDTWQDVRRFFLAEKPVAAAG